MSNDSLIPRVNQYECCKCGLCSYALPEVFRMTPEGVSEAYAPEGSNKEKIQKVIDNCPVNCIHWYRHN